MLLLFPNRIPDAANSIGFCTGGKAQPRVGEVSAVIRPEQ
jgi:hypothetical protein